MLHCWRPFAADHCCVYVEVWGLVLSWCTPETLRSGSFSQMFQITRYRLISACIWLSVLDSCENFKQIIRFSKRGNLFSDRKIHQIVCLTTGVNSSFWEWWSSVFLPIYGGIIDLLETIFIPKLSRSVSRYQKKANEGPKIYDHVLKYKVWNFVF